MDSIDKIEELLYVLFALASIIIGVMYFKNVHKEPIHWPFFETKFRGYCGAILLILIGIAYLINKN